MDKAGLISLFEKIASLLELKGENPFKIRAYQNAARALETETADLNELIQANKLQEIAGIGKAIAEKILEFQATGKLAYYEELKESVPQALFELTQIPGLGPKKAKKIYEALGVQSVGELEYACQENRLLKLPGFGKKTQDNILKSIQFYRKNQNQFLYADAIREANAVLAVLKKDKAIQEISIAGSLRRRKEIVRDMDFVVATDKPGSVMKKFVSLPGIQSVLAEGETKSSVILASGIQADLRCVQPAEYPFALHHFTGSKEHNVKLRGLAQEKGLKINEYGIFKGEKLIACKSEAEIYQALGLHFVPPELREDRGEIERAAQSEFPEMIALSDLKGTFHAHTTYSDGSASVAEMALAAQKMGLNYLGISDHSQTAVYAHGLKADDIKRQHAEIDAFNRENPDFRIFKGIESDILADGSLDYESKILEQFDFVIASVHSRFKMNEAEMTERIAKALQNPYTTILGHMTGRLLLSRDPYAIDAKKIIDTAVKYNKVIELNCNPYRLDMDWRHLEYARDAGLKIAINPDAHKPGGIADLEYGIGIARKGGITKGDVINTLDKGEMEKFLGTN